MDEYRSKDILERLLDAITAEEVKTILDKESFTDADWKPYGGKEANYDRVGNQQSRGLSALTELITNSIDSILCRKAIEADIDITGKNAPQTMQDALRDACKIQEGRISHLDYKQKSKLAEKSILIGVKRRSGFRKFPTITIFDFGEGQNPNDFPETFVSLSNGNKVSIPFVQGKYNMGSTGSIRFCTRSEISLGHYKLIASKRYDGDYWGWTIVRVAKVQEGQKLPVTQYLCPDGQISRFKSDTLPPFGKTLAEQAGDLIKPVNQGSIVKLYEYRIGDGAHDIDFGLRQGLMLNLIDCALPIKIYDFDPKVDKSKGPFRARGIAESVFSGLLVRSVGNLADQSEQNPDLVEKKPEKETTEFIHMVSDSSLQKLGKIKIVAIGLSQMPVYISKPKKRIFYTINGQTHATERASFLNRIGMGDLQENLIVDVQCENMDKTAVSIFLGNRESMTENSYSEELKEHVITKLKEDPKLREYAGIIRRRRAKHFQEEDKETKKLLSNLLSKDPALRALFGLGDDVLDISVEPGKTKKWTEGKQFPTFLTPQNVEEKNNSYIKELPLLSHRRLRCKTDAVNDYLQRSNSPGVVICDFDGIDWSVKLHNGIASFTFTAPETAKVNDEINFRIGFNDTSRATPLDFSLTLKITEEEEKITKKGGEKVDVKPKHNPVLADPIEWATKENWNEHGFDEKSGARVIKSYDEMKIYVNKDHERLHAMRQKESNELTRTMIEQKYKLALGVLTLALFHNGEDIDIDTEKVSNISDAIAPYILSLINIWDKQA